MLNRRLWILFLAFLLAFVLLAFRLGKLQITDAQLWRDRLSLFVHQNHPIETYRGSILDRNGLPLARDVPSDELAIDYRAMNLDDDWLWKKAVERLRANGEWGHFPDKPTRDRRVEEVKGEIAAQIDAIPTALAAALAQIEHVPQDQLLEEILGRYQDIRARIHTMRQDLYSRKFARDASQAPWGGASADTTSDIDDSALDARFRKIQLLDEVAAHTIRANIPSSVALYFKQHLAEFPGLLVRDQADHNWREYPFGEATVHLVGTLRSIDKATLDAHRFDLPNLLVPGDTGDLAGYSPGDRMGGAGVEKLMEETLRGRRGAGLIDLTDSGESRGKDTRRVEPLPGKDVQLTLDAALQRDIYSALKNPATARNDRNKNLLLGEDKKEHAVALVILSMDGQLLTSISYPSYDPATLDENYNQLSHDAYHTPLLNRAINGQYQPGSTVKPLLASAALTESLITRDTSVVCTGHFYPNRPDAFRCDQVHGDITLVDAIAQSCNVYFFTVGQKLGLPRLEKWYDLYGFGRQTGMELPEAVGTIPRVLPNMEPDEAVRQSLFAGIGQDKITTTPLQLANAYATLLRGGVAIPPRILTTTPMVQTHPFDLSAATLVTVREGMERCTTLGTAKSIFRDFRPRVAGKTGTAEKIREVYDDAGDPVDDTDHPLLNANGTPRLKPDGTPMFRQRVRRDDDAWFVGYAPIDKPRYIVAAIMEWGGHGGVHAAPMVAEAFAQLQAHGYFEAQ